MARGDLRDDGDIADLVIKEGMYICVFSQPHGHDAVPKYVRSKRKSFFALDLLLL